MKAKKPFLLIAFVLALLAVMLILPSVAVGSGGPPDNHKPVNWVSSGENSNNDHRWDAEPFQGGHAVFLQQMADGSLKGHATFIGILPGTAQLHTTTFLAYDPYTEAPIDHVFYEENGYKVAEFVMDFGAGSEPFRYYKLILKDGGEPKTADVEQDFMGIGEDPYPWGFFVPFTEQVPYSNIQVHFTEEL